MNKTRAKKFKVRIFYHLQNLFWGFLSGGFLAWGFLSGGFCCGGFCPGDFCPDTSKSQFDRINKFVEVHSYHFTPLDSLHDNITDSDDDSNLVADVDPDTLIHMV